MILALEVEADQDLRPLSVWLSGQGVPHRVFEASGRLRLTVPDERLVAVVRDAWLALHDGRIEPPPTPTAAARSVNLAAAVRATLMRAPVTAALVLLTLLMFPATWTDGGSLPAFTLRWLMIVPIETVDEFIRFATLRETLRAGEFWHLWTPALLHFGAMHLVFNLLWLWEFGRRIETAEGRWRLLGVVIVLAPVANGVQYLMDEGPLFGGLSGVVYGLLGYIVTAWRRGAHPEYNLNAALVVMLVLLLILFSTGVTEPFGLGIANGAHWGGLVAGILLAVIHVRERRSAAANPTADRADRADEDDEDDEDDGSVR